MKKSENKPAPNISGTFQTAEDTRIDDLHELKQKNDLDEESLYYARLFMED